MRVMLIKPATDVRDGADMIRSRIGLAHKCEPLTAADSIMERFVARKDSTDVIIADESQFFTPENIDQMRRVVDELNVPVMCFGLRTDFLTKLFPGSMRLFELADSISEIKTICSCGKKASVNARIDENGKIVTEGSQVMLGGNDSYVAMCHRCYKKGIGN